VRAHPATEKQNRCELSNSVYEAECKDEIREAMEVFDRERLEREAQIYRELQEEKAARERAVKANFDENQNFLAFFTKCLRL